MKFENILLEIDGFGPFQIVTVILLCVPRIILPLHFMMNIFIAAVPSHRCDISSLDDGGMLRNLSREERLVVSVPLLGDGTPSSCSMFAEPQFNLLSNVSGDINLPTVQCQSGWVYDNGTFSSTLATEWDLVCDQKSMNKATVTIFFIGVMFGAISFGALSDKFGRKSALLVSYIITFIFGISSAFSTSYIMFAILRFLTGFGIIGISLIPVVLSIEWVDVGHRAHIGVMGSMAWSLGNMLLAACAYLVRDWRMLIITVTAPVCVALLTWWWVPESARWLLANGQVERAKFHIEKCARLNKRENVCSKITLETLSNMQTEDKSKNYSYLDLMKTPKMRKLSLLVGIVWYGIASTYYGISLNITGFGLNIYLTHFIYAAIEVPAKLITYYLLNIIGRRTCQAGTLLLTGTFIAINIFMPKGFWYVRTIVAILGKGSSEASFSTIFLYTPELYPTVVRQSGMGYVNFISRVGVSLAPMILLLEDVWTFLPEVIICFLAVLSGLVSLLLPETLNVRLPETIEDIEQQSAHCLRRKAIPTSSLDISDNIL